MKENVLSAGKKFAVIFLASLMLLGVVPIGMISRPTTVNAEGEFLRFSPVSETFTAVGISNNSLSEGRISSDFQPIGSGYDGYLKFNIESLLEKDIEKIHTAKLRVSAFPAGESRSVPVRLWLVSDKNRLTPLIQSQVNLNVGEIKLAEATVSTENPLVEFDLTEQLKSWIENSVTEVTFHLDAPGGSVAFAGTKCEDNSYRPCFKVITGEASDPDPTSLAKTTLEEYRRERGNTYLRFRLSPENIQGAVYMAELKLDNLNFEEDAVLSVYQGASLLCQEPLKNDKDYVSLNLTDYINTLCRNGGEEVSLTVTEKSGKRIFFSNSPSLKLWVSDNPDVVAVTEAMGNALGNNSDSFAVCENLLSQYTSLNQKNVSISWETTNVNTGETSILVSHTGTVIQPKWFEEPETVQAVATIRSGDYTRKRGYILRIVPENAPDYSAVDFSDIVLIGNTTSESAQAFESVEAPIRVRMVGSKTFFCREVTQDSTLVVNLKKVTDGQNYITVKTCEKDLTDATLIITPLNSDGEPILINVAEDISDGGDGFLYLTYPLPAKYTEGNDYVSLKLSCIPKEGIEGSFCLYGVYLGENPCFDPLKYSDQGEVLAENEDLVDVTLSKFLGKFYEITKHPFPFLKADAEALEATEEAVADEIATEKPVITDETGNTIIFKDKNERVAVSVTADNLAQIYRNSVLYDSYSQVNAVKSGDLTVIDYGTYKIIQNTSDKEFKPDWNSMNLSGVYTALGSEEYYTFLESGQLLDDSVIPHGAAYSDGKDLAITPNDTLVLIHLAEPLYSSDWRVSKINGKTISQIKLYGEMPISQVSIKNVGSAPETAEELTVICGVYEQGRLVGLTKQDVIPADNNTESVAYFEKPLALNAGQTLKIFIEPKNQTPRLMTPKAELP